MTIGRTDDPENPPDSPAFEAATLFGTGSRTPSGPADIVPRQQAGHMIAIDPPVKISSKLLHPRGRPHMSQSQFSAPIEGEIPAPNHIRAFSLVRLGSRKDGK